jgi:hypothetical protein
MRLPLPRRLQSSRLGCLFIFDSSSPYAAMLAAELPSGPSASHELLHTLLEVSLPGIILFRPVYAADDAATILDLAYVFLNPAAQQMLRLPAGPPETFRTCTPTQWGRASLPSTATPF